MADANKDRRRAPAEPCTRLERGENAANGPLRRDLATIREVALDQPVTECRRLEPVNLVRGCRPAPVQKAAHRPSEKTARPARRNSTWSTLSGSILGLFWPSNDGSGPESPTELPVARLRRGFLVRGRRRPRRRGGRGGRGSVTTSVRTGPRNWHHRHAPPSRHPPTFFRGRRINDPIHD